MATVMVTIDGKSYRMACEEGQEKHLAHLAARLDRYISHLKNSFGEIGDRRLSVMAGIMVMDEMVELEARIATLEEENHALIAAQSNKVAALSESEQQVAAKIDAITKRVEILAAQLLPKNDKIDRVDTHENP